MKNSTTGNPLGGGGTALVVGRLKKNTFFCGFLKLKHELSLSGRKGLDINGFVTFWSVPGLSEAPDPNKAGELLQLINNWNNLYW